AHVARQCPVQIQAACPRHRGENVPDESRAVDPEAAYAVQVVVDVGCGDAPRLREDAGLVGEPGVDAPFHLIDGKPVARHGPAARLQVEYHDLFMAVGQCV